MPQMRVKATVADWNDSSLIGDNARGLIKTFFNNSPMYAYGSFTDDGTYDHMSCCWQSNEVVFIDNSISEGSDISLDRTVAMCLPYSESSLVVADDAVPVVGNKDCGVYPDVNTTLTRALTQRMYLNEYKYNEPITGNVMCKLFASNSVSTCAYIGTNENIDDEKIKPSNVTVETPLLAVRPYKNTSSSEVLYLANTSDFILSLKKAKSNIKEYHRVFYKIGIVPFEIREEEKEADYSIEDTDGVAAHMINDCHIYFGDENITVDGNKSLMCYFVDAASSQAVYKFCVKLSSPVMYDAIPTNVILPFYIYPDTNLRGLVYMQLFAYDASSGIDYEFNINDNTSVLFNCVGIPKYNGKTSTEIDDETGEQSHLLLSMQHIE